MGTVRPLGDADPRTIGPYRLTGRLGTATAGAVFLAEAADERPVVVTVADVTDAEADAEAAFRAQFAERADAVRRVLPFATAQVLDVDASAAHPYVVTEYVDGPTLAGAVREHGPMGVLELARFAGGVANALAAVHAAGIAHQHLHPGNVVLSTAGPTRLVDLAGPRRPGGGAVPVGPTGFAAPEQLLGEPGSPAGDVYAWGALVLFAATGRLPHGDGHPRAVVHRILHSPPDLTGLDRRLAPVVASALVVSPTARPSAHDVVAALLVGTPRVAPAVPAAVVAALGAVTNGASSTAALSTAAPLRAGRPATPPSEAGTTTQPIPPPAGAPPPAGPLPIRPLPTGSLPTVSKSPAKPSSRSTAPLRSRPATPPYPPAKPPYLPAKPPGPSPVPRTPTRTAAAVGPARLGPVVTTWTQVARRRLRRPFFLLPAALCLVAATVLSYVTFSGDDKTSVQAAGMIQPGELSGAEPPLVQPSPFGRAIFGHTDGVTALAFSPDGTTLATAGNDYAIRFWDLEDPATPRQLGAPLTAPRDVVSSLAYSPDGTVLAAASGDEILLWNVTDPNSPRRYGSPPSAHNSDVRAVAISPDGTMLASGGVDRTVVLWDITSAAAPARLGQPLGGHTDTVSSVAYSPDGTTLVSASHDGTAILWDVTDPGQARRIGEPLAGHSDGVRSAVFSPNGTVLATAGRDRTVMLWDIGDPNRPRQLGEPLADPTGSARSVAFSPDGVLLATAGDDGTVSLRDVTDPAAPGPVMPALPGHSDAVNVVAFSPDGTILATASDDSTVGLWSLAG